jgi:hypothetical protein
MAADDLIVVGTFPDRFAADVAKSALEAAGIECLERSDDAGGMRPHLAFASGVRLIVRAEDAPRAVQILKSPNP